jgi:hypothetical protein
MTREKIRLGVIELLKSDPRCRNDDKWLIWRYFREKAGIKIYIPFDDFNKMPSFESVRRIRAHLQNVEKKFLPTDPKIRTKRRINEEEWKQWLLRAKELYGLEE